MIKNIIFDLGGVILNIDFPKAVEEFRKLGVADIDKIYTGYIQSSFFDSYDKGLISDPDFIIGLKKYIPSPVSDQQVCNAWNSMILDFPEDRIELLKNLKKKFRLFLLSNTNSIHYPVYNKQLKDKFGIPDLSNLFEKVYYSFQMGLRKPDPEIFNRVTIENNLVPDETLFIDDSPLNLEAAEKLGLKTLLFKSSDLLRNVLYQNGIG
jgi:glucose-1-phosphatase